MNLMRLEQETIILFNEAEDSVEVYTHNAKMTKRLLALAEKHPDLVSVADKTFVLPKSLCRFSFVSPISEEQKERVRQMGLAQIPTLLKYRRGTPRKSNANSEVR